jgi:hypothetical protein
LPRLDGAAEVVVAWVAVVVTAPVVAGADATVGRPATVVLGVGAGRGASAAFDAATASRARASAAARSSACRRASRAAASAASLRCSASSRAFSVATSDWIDARSVRRLPSIAPIWARLRFNRSTVRSRSCSVSRSEMLAAASRSLDRRASSAIRRSEAATSCEY